MPLRVCVLALDGVSDSSLAVTLDTFAAANRLSREVLERSEPFLVEVATVSGRAVRGGSGLVVKPARALRDVRRSDLVVLPGMGMASREEVDRVLARADVARMVRWLGERGRRGRPLVASSCSGVFLLAAAGLLDGRAATTTWWLLADLARRFPRITVDLHAMVVDAGPVITAGASFAQLDLLLRLVSRLVGPELAALLTRYLVLDERPSQARYAIAHHVTHDSPLVQGAERWIRAHLSQPLRIDSLARALGTTHRTLSRRVHEATGLSPVRFVQSLRVESARHLLATTRASVEEIAARVGYESSASLRRALTRHVGATPRELRASAP